MRTEITIKTAGAESADCDSEVSFVFESTDDAASLGVCLANAVRAVNIARPVAAMAKAVDLLCMFSDKDSDTNESTFANVAGSILKQFGMR